jgi:AraC-like DNA-binding protein
LKLDAGKQLIETGQPISQVAARIGFQSESAFKARYGITPSLHAQMYRVSAGRTLSQPNIHMQFASYSGFFSNNR